MADRATAGLRAVALLEASKGALVLLAGFGLLALIHGEAQALAEAIVGRFHLNPAHHAPRVFLNLAAKATDGRLWTLALSALAYASVRFVEAWGLWRARAWAEWLGALSGAIYLPLEAYALATRPTPLHAALLGVNLVVVGVLARALWASRR